MSKYVCILALLAVCSAVPKGCHKYECGKSNYFTAKQCVVPAEEANTLKLKVCEDSKEYCPLLTSFAESVSCQSVDDSSSSTNLLPGQACKEGSNCKSSKCEDDVCVGEDEGSSCLDNDECKPTLRCAEKGTCEKLIAVGSSGCADDSDCVNSAGCNNLLKETNGTCVKYYSLKADEKIGKCESGLSLLCESMTCKTTSDSSAAGVCINGYVSVSRPIECDQDSDCVSKENESGSCSCGFNPSAKGYCNLFYGDKEWQKVIDHRKVVIEDKNYDSKCHTLNRHSEDCVLTLKGKKFYNQYIQDIEMANNFPLIQGNDACAKYIYNQKYWNAYRYNQESEDDEDEDYSNILGVAAACLLVILY